MSRVLIMAGGTGGHVFPALAVAEELRGRGIEVCWMGTRQGLEATVVPAAGIPMEWVSIGGLRGKGAKTLLLAPFQLARAATQVLGIMLRRRPSVVLGMGGFVTGPGGVMTWLLRLPLVIHEQNAIAGFTNRMLAPLAHRVLEAFPATFKRKRVYHTGNPVRRAIAELPEPAQRFSQREGSLRLLVLGGSLGARALNETLPRALARLPDDQRPDVWHQAGKRNIDEARAAYAAAGVEGRVEPFIDDMAQAYAWADLVICRAGALTIAELAAAGVGAILVPFPFAVDDHQTHNARYLADHDAAVCIQQKDLSDERLAQLLGEYAAAGRPRLLAMAQAARALAKTDAAAHVARHCLEVAYGRA